MRRKLIRSALGAITLGAVILGSPSFVLATDATTSDPDLPSSVMGPEPPSTSDVSGVETPPPTSAPQPKSIQPEAEPMVTDKGPKDELYTRPGEATEDDILRNPTRYPEEYERVRMEKLYRASIPYNSVNITLEPHAFGNADFRIPPTGDPNTPNPTLFGILLGYERALIRSAGLFMIGLDAGFYTSTQSDPYGGMTFGFPSVAPHLLYQGVFLHKQWVVPAVEAEYQFLRYSYSFNNNNISGLKMLPRVDLGLLVFLNPLEPASSANMKSDYGVKRVYLSAYYTIANDSSKTNFDASDRTFRVGLRFEF